MMPYLVMLGMAAAVFALLFAFVAACGRLIAPRPEEVDEP